MRSKIQRSIDGPGGATDAFAAGNQQLRSVGDPNVTKPLPDRLLYEPGNPAGAALPTSIN